MTLYFPHSSPLSLACPVIRGRRYDSLFSSSMVRLLFVFSAMSGLINGTILHCVQVILEDSGCESMFMNCSPYFV